MFAVLLYHIKIFSFSLLEWFKTILWKLNLQKTHYLRVIDNHFFTFTHAGIITQFIYARQHLVGKRQGFESKTLQLFANSLKTGDIVLDIGANIGVFTLLGAKLVGETGKIYAFEPSKSTFDTLSKNLELNEITNAFPQQIALSNSTGKINLAVVEDDALRFIDVKNQNSGGESVKMVMLDNWLQENQLKKVDLIKIDIEGAEFLCFKGAIDMLKNMPPTIIMECNEKWCKRFDYSVFEFLTFLHSFGYTFEQYEEAQWICNPPK